VHLGTWNIGVCERLHLRRAQSEHMCENTFATLSPDSLSKKNSLSMRSKCVYCVVLFRFASNSEMIAGMEEKTMEPGTFLNR
jgi:hypothetical protein